MTLTEEMAVATRYQSHLSALLACIAVTDGPVLELGVGHFSTPQLHALCGALKRTLISVEPDEIWREEFRHRYASRIHYFYVDYARLNVDVALIDHSPGGVNRANAFKVLIAASKFVVMHDAQKDAENFQAVEPMLPDVRWHLCTSYFPHTLVASKTKEIPNVLLDM